MDKLSAQEIKHSTRATPPQSVPALRTLTMPADANPNGDIFGGWLMSQMDVAGGIHAYSLSGGRIATFAVDGMSFHLPVHIGDLISCHCVTERTGPTSIAVKVETWVKRRADGREEKVTEGLFTYVAIDAKGRPRPLPVGES